MTNSFKFSLVDWVNLFLKVLSYSNMAAAGVYSETALEAMSVFYRIALWNWFREELGLSFPIQLRKNQRRKRLRPQNSPIVKFDTTPMHSQAETKLTIKA